MEVAQQLTFVEVVPGLPPEGFGAVVSLVDLLAPDVRRVLESPLDLLLSPEQAAPCSLRAKVHATPHQWGLIAGHCVRLGIMREIAFHDIYRHQGVPVLNGAFGVLKKGKLNAEGGRVLRLIMNLIPRSH